MRIERALRSRLRHKCHLLSNGLARQSLSLPGTRKDGVVEGVTCIELLDELEEKLRAKLRLPEDHIVETLADLLGFLRLVTIANTLKVVAADPDDDKVLECALVADATHIVTGDRRHLLPLRSYKGIEIVSPAEFVALAAASQTSTS